MTSECSTPVLTPFIQFDEATLERLRAAPRPDQSMGIETFEGICRQAWEQLPDSTPWADLEPAARDSYREDVRWVLTAAADAMPIETLHGADGASVWLRGDQ